MDELSTERLRSAAFEANLRRAFGGPISGDLPCIFAELLDRLSEVPSPSPERTGDPLRLGA